MTNFTFPKENDYDLRAAIEYNTVPFSYDDIEGVELLEQGERDSGNNWTWKLKLKDGTIGALTGGCDYTGWDCRSWLTWTPEEKESVNECQG